ncbi:MAG TPA: radical SAM protein [Kofleriaceae bacterium]
MRLSGLRRARPTAVLPLHVQVEVTWRCNWRCVHCYQDDHAAEPLSTAVLASLFDQLRALGAMHVIVTGGEPLVRGDLFELLEHARATGLAITLYTNGHAIDEPAADRLAALVGAVELSVLAGAPDVHDQLSSVRGSFARTVAAIERLRARDVAVVVKTPVMRPALATLPALRARMVELGVEWQPDLDLTETYAGDAAPLAYRLDDVERDAFLAAHPELRARPRDPGVRDDLCLAGRQFAFVDALGGVYPCLSFRGDRRAAMLGNIRERPFAEIWHGAPLLAEIRAASRADFTTCTSCGGRDTCRPCMAYNFREHGSLFDPARATCDLTAAMRSDRDPGFVPASALARRGI